MAWAWAVHAWYVSYERGVVLVATRLASSVPRWSRQCDTCRNSMCTNVSCLKCRVNLSSTLRHCLLLQDMKYQAQQQDRSKSLLVHGKGQR
jgi:hypothetical protein